MHFIFVKIVIYYVKRANNFAYKYLGVYFMKNKLKLATLVMCMMIPLSCLLTACDNHEHIMDSTWTNDSNYHWHACTKDGCDEKSNCAEHTFGDWIVDEDATFTQEGSKHRKCSVCYHYQYETVPILSSEGLSFTLNEDGESYSFSGLGTCTDNIIYIPSMYEGKPVTEIAKGPYSVDNNQAEASVKRIIMPNTITKINKYAFKAYTNLEHVTFSNNLSSIGEDAFSSGSKFKSLILPGSLISIPHRSFAGMSSLEELVISQGTKVIESAAFMNCSKLKKVTLPDGLETIQTSAFKSCVALESITLPSGLKTIKDNAFAYTGLKSVVVPDSVTTLEFNAFMHSKQLESVHLGKGVTSYPEQGYFSECIKLSSITVSEDNTALKSIDGNLYSKDGETLLCYAEGKEAKTFVVPSHVKTLAKKSFNYCINLTQIIIPKTVTKICSGACSDWNTTKTICYYGSESEWNQIVEDEWFSTLAGGYKIMNFDYTGESA